MDNLEQLWCQTVRLNESEYGKCISCSSSQDLVCFISDTNYIGVYDHVNPDKLIAKKIEGKEVKQIHYLAVHDVIFLATDYELLLYNRHTFQYDVHYVSEKKIIAFAWNPAETAVVLIDEADKIFLCNFSTPKFDNLYSNDLYADVPSSVYVGWGSENTQFQGPKSRQKKVKEKGKHKSQ